MKAIVEVRFSPRQVRTVRDAVDLLLLRTGFVVVEGESADPYQATFLSGRLPQTLYNIGPSPLYLVLDSIAGNERVVSYDYVRRMISFDLLPEFRTRHSSNNIRTAETAYSPTPNRDWTIRANTTFSSGIENWAQQYDWHLVWDLPTNEDFIFDHDYTVRDEDLFGAINTAIRDYRKHGPPLSAQYVLSQRLVYVSLFEVTTP
jgi:hypothetical protein